MTARSSFKQADATRALRAALAAGLKPRGYRIEPDGSLYVDIGDEGAATKANPLDRLLTR